MKTKIFLLVGIMIFCVLMSDIKMAYAGCCVGSGTPGPGNSSLKEEWCGGTWVASDCDWVDECKTKSSGSTKTDPATACKTWFTPGTPGYDNCLKQYQNSGGGAGSGGNTSINFQNPIGASTLMQVLTNLLNSLKSVVIIIAVIFIIIGGLMYMMSGGNEKTITRAKACVSGAVIGLAIVLAAPIFLNEVLRIFGGATSVPTQGMTSSMTIAAVASNVLNFLLSILGIIAIISLVVGGGMYLTAYGDEKRIETGKKTIKYAVLGIVIALSSILIVREVGNLLGESTTSGYPSNMSNPSIPGLGTGTGTGVNPINVPINIPRN